MSLKSHCTALLAALAFAGTVAIAPAAEGQIAGIHPSFYGSGEWDTGDSQFYLLGVYLGVSKLGWSPYVNANAYRLSYDNNGQQGDLSGFSPTLGFAHAARKGGYSVGAGYTWTDSDDSGAPGSEGGGSSGIHAAVGAYRNGSGDRPVRTQFLSNYNFGSEYLWARLRASVPMADRIRVGAELVGQGGGKGATSSNSFKAGPTVEYQWSDNVRSAAVVGYKTTGGSRFPAGRDSAPYFKLEFSLSPF
ncbi:MAG: hypothetical protein ABIS15_09215 [Gemmatimonadaceae bacterium]